MTVFCACFHSSVGDPIVVGPFRSRTPTSSAGPHGVSPGGNCVIQWPARADCGGDKEAMNSLLRGTVVCVLSAGALIASACSEPLVCPTATADCGDVCSYLDRDPSNCGACGVQCVADQVCAAGRCTATCVMGGTLPGIVCAGSCIYPKFDSANCGACGRACIAPQTCNQGVCS